LKAIDTQAINISYCKSGRFFFQQKTFQRLPSTLIRCFDWLQLNAKLFKAFSSFSNTITDLVECFILKIKASLQFKTIAGTLICATGNLRSIDMEIKKYYSATTTTLLTVNALLERTSFVPPTSVDNMPPDMRHST